MPKIKRSSSSEYAQKPFKLVGTFVCRRADAPAELANLRGGFQLKNALLGSPQSILGSRFTSEAPTRKNRFGRLRTKMRECSAILLKRIRFDALD